MFTEYSKGVILPTKGGQQQTAAQTNAATVSVNDSKKKSLKSISKGSL